MSQEQLFLKRMRQVMHLADMRSSRLLREVGISSTQAGVLRVLAECEEMTAGELSREICLTGATLTGVLDRLEARGWITRLRRAEDKRQLAVRILPEGLEKLRETETDFADPLTEGFCGLPPSRQEAILDTLSCISGLFSGGDFVESVERER